MELGIAKESADSKDAANANIPSSAETYEEVGVEQIYLGFFKFLCEI